MSRSKDPEKDHAKKDRHEAALIGEFGLGPGASKVKLNNTLKDIREAEVFRLCLMGYTGDQIADSLGVKRNVISRIVNSPGVQDRLERRQSELKSAALRRIKLQSESLVGVIMSIAKGENGDEKAADRLKAACAALDRIGIVANPGAKQVEISIGPAMTTGELIKRADEIKAELKKLEAASKQEVRVLEAEIIDLEPEPEEEEEADDDEG